MMEVVIGKGNLGAGADIAKRCSESLANFNVCGNL
jgi:hypothetical protein